MKAVLVLDMPTGCIGCPCYYEERGKCQNTWENVEDDCARPSWCPLKPLPKKGCGDEDDIEQTSYFDGWNDCLKEITE